jgi:hypothetical protein
MPLHARAADARPSARHADAKGLVGCGTAVVYTAVQSIPEAPAGRQRSVLGEAVMDTSCT